MSDLVERLNQIADAEYKKASPWSSLGTPASRALYEAAAELTRLRARPTEEEIVQAITGEVAGWPYGELATLDIARAVLALFPKAQP